MHRSIARENGTRIIADPSLALDAITRQQVTFTRRDMVAFAHCHSDGPGQFDAVLGASQVDTTKRLLDPFRRDGAGDPSCFVRGGASHPWDHCSENSAQAAVRSPVPGLTDPLNPTSQPNPTDGIYGGTDQRRGHFYI